GHQWVFIFTSYRTPFLSICNIDKDSIICYNRLCNLTKQKEKHMSESANPQFNPNTGMRAQGEADRSPEYKEARDAFVQRVNEFLGSMKALQEQGGMVEIPGGMTLPIETEARMTTTFLGINNRGFRSFANHEQGGISLTGDGEFSPLELQALLP